MSTPFRALLCALPSTKNPTCVSYLAAAWRGPDPQDISAAVGQPDITTTPATVSVGNPNLKAEYAWDYDILYERNLSPLGLIQAGYFYKDLSNPIVTIQTLTTTYPYNPGCSDTCFSTLKCRQRACAGCRVRISATAFLSPRGAERIRHLSQLQLHLFAGTRCRPVAHRQSSSTPPGSKQLECQPDFRHQALFNAGGHDLR